MSNKKRPKDSGASVERRAFGTEIARLRQHREWTRPVLLRHLDTVMASFTTEAQEPLSEAWLHRLENGQVVKLSVQMVRALCEALECNNRERAKLLLLGGWNVLLFPPFAPAAVRECFNFIMADIYVDVCEVLEKLIGQQAGLKMTEDDLVECIFTAIEVVIGNRRKQRE